jgi:programmed cell death protein 4
MGETKKGGAGGKYTWGRPGMDDLNTARPDQDDPAFDSEDEEDVQNTVVRPSNVADAQEEYKKKCSAILDEYFTSEDYGEVARSLQEINEGAWGYEFVKVSVVKALEKRDRERELVARLFSSLYGSILPESQIEKGFWLVLERLPDSSLDTPGAPDIVGDFIARAVVDEIIAPAFVHRTVGDSDAAKQALAKAKRHLEGKGVSERVYNIWGQNSSVVHSAKKLKRSMRTLLEEYLEDGGDVAEADRCLRELNVPTAHFQFVKIAVTLALERKDIEKRKISALLKAFASSELVSEAHMISGFKCCVDCVGDLAKDISPNARTLFLEFVSLAIAENYLPVAFRAKAEAETEKILDRLKEEESKVKAASSPAEKRETPAKT